MNSKWCQQGHREHSAHSGEARAVLTPPHMRLNEGRQSGVRPAVAGWLPQLEPQSSSAEKCVSVWDGGGGSVSCGRRFGSTTLAVAVVGWKPRTQPAPVRMPTAPCMMSPTCTGSQRTRQRQRTVGRLMIIIAVSAGCSSPISHHSLQLAPTRAASTYRLGRTCFQH
jgi:hypothetical protein